LAGNALENREHGAAKAVDSCAYVQLHGAWCKPEFQPLQMKHRKKKNHHYHH
jgi:hypothetical protein